MTLEKFKISYKTSGQSVLEYTLLVTIAIVGLLVGTMFLSKLKDDKFEQHFKAAGHKIGGDAYAPPDN